MKQQVKLIEVPFEPEKNMKKAYSIDGDGDLRIRSTDDELVYFVEFYLVSDEFPKIGDYFAEKLTTGELQIFHMSNLNDPQRDDCKRVIAFPKQIAYIPCSCNFNEVESVNKDPSIMFDEEFPAVVPFKEGQCYVKVSIQQLQQILDRGGDCEIEMEFANGGYSNTNDKPPLIPKLIDNKIIIHI
jgi:hypothetical protein